MLLFKLEIYDIYVSRCIVGVCVCVHVYIQCFFHLSYVHTHVMFAESFSYAPPPPTASVEPLSISSGRPGYVFFDR